MAKVYCKMQKGMYGLPQAGIIAQQLLKERLISMDIVKAKQPPVSGNMTPDPSASPLLSMILG